MNTNTTSSATILAIDTSTAACSVALLLGDKVFSRHQILPQRHAQQVLFMVDEVLQDAAITSDQIDYLAFGEGPGAFTGVRIAAGVVQGLAMGWNKPVIAMSSLETMAQQLVYEYCSDKTSLQHSGSTLKWCALLDARMNEIYCLQGLYTEENGIEVSAAVSLLTPEAVAEVIQDTDIGCGDIEQTYASMVEGNSNYLSLLPNAIYMAQLAQHKTEQAFGVSERVPQPLYLRNNVAETIEQRKQKKQAQ